MITLKHPGNGMLQECPTGISYTTFFFGALVPLFRKDFKWAAIFFGGALLLGVILEELPVSSSSMRGLFIGLSSAYAYLYNDLYIKEKLEQGYIPADDVSKNWLVQKGILASNQNVDQDANQKETP